MAAREETVCSFQEIVGGHCGFQTKDRSKSVEVIPLLQCKRSIGAHKSALALTGVENEVDLILSRASVFVPPRNVDKLCIYPRHRESLGLPPKILRCASYFQLSSQCLDIPMKHCLECLIYYVQQLEMWPRLPKLIFPVGWVL